MSEDYSALDTTNVKVTRVDEVVQQESEAVAVVVEQEQDVEAEQEPIVEKVVSPALVVQRPVLCFLENLVRPF